MEKAPTLKSTDLKTGEKIYTKNCVECHQKNGSGSKTLRVPPLYLQPDWYILEQLIKFENGQRLHSKDFRLNSWGVKAKDIAAYINTLKVEEQTE